MWKEVLLLVILLSCIQVAGAESAPQSSIQISEPGFRPGYLSDTIPLRLEPGKTYPVMIRFQNTGLVSWVNNVRRTGLVYGGDLLSVVAMPSFVEIPDGASILPGQDIGFAFTLLPVGKPGVYDLPFFVSMRSAQDDLRISEVFTKTIEIVPPDGISSPVNGSIAVESPARQLSVSVNNVPQGVTPSIIPDLKPGEYKVQVIGFGYQKDIPVRIEKGSIVRIFLDNSSSGPRIERRTANPVSDGSILAIMKANVPLILVILAIICGCAGVMVYGIKKRRKEEDEDKKAIAEKDGEKTPDDIRLEAERDLLKRIHEKPRAFGMASTVGNAGDTPAFGGGGMEDILKNVEYHELTEVHSAQEVMEARKEEEWKTLMEGPEPGMALAEGDKNETTEQIDLSVLGMETKPGSTTVLLSIKNKSREILKLLDEGISPGGQVTVEADIDEPEDDTYETTISLSFITEKGLELLKEIHIPYNKGIALLARGMIEKAYEYFSRILNQEPERVDALLQKADILIKWGLEKEALLILEKAKELDPDDEDVLAAMNRLQKHQDSKKTNTKKETKKVPGFPDPVTEKYTPLRILGEDPFAIIYLVIRVDTGDLRVLKIPRDMESPSSTLMTDVSILYQAKHPNVLRMFRAEFSPVPFLELEYVSGADIDGRHVTTLADFIVPVRMDICIRLIEGIGAGLSYLHKKGIRHYYIQPSIILLDDKMIPKISGLVRGSFKRYDSNETKKPFIQAPEQVNASIYGRTGKKTDIFQLGAVWYYLCTGYRPDSPDLQLAYGVSGTDDHADYPKLVLPSVMIPELKIYDTIFMKLLATRKEDRYTDVDEFLSDLDSVKKKGYIPDENDGTDRSDAE